jgi:hypothetical protein
VINGTAGCTVTLKLIKILMLDVLLKVKGGKEVE